MSSERGVLPTSYPPLKISPVPSRNGTQEQTSSSPTTLPIVYDRARRVVVLLACSILAVWYWYAVVVAVLCAAYWLSLDVRDVSKVMERSPDDVTVLHGDS